MVITNKLNNELNVSSEATLEIDKKYVMSYDTEVVRLLKKILCEQIDTVVTEQATRLDGVTTLVFSISLGIEEVEELAEEANKIYNNRQKSSLGPFFAD